MNDNDDKLSHACDLLYQAAMLGLTFERGRAYISRAYIDSQDELMTKIKALMAHVAEEKEQSK